MMPTLLSLVLLEAVVMTTYGAISDDKVGIMTTLGFQWYPMIYTDAIIPHQNKTTKGKPWAWINFNLSMDK